MTRIKVAVGLGALLLLGLGMTAALAAGGPSQAGIDAQAAAHDEVNPAGHTRGWASHGPDVTSETEDESVGGDLETLEGGGPSEAGIAAQEAAHSPINPAGKTRGWAKEHSGSDPEVTEEGDESGSRPESSPRGPQATEGSNGAGNAHGGNSNASERASSGSVRDDG